MSLMSNKDWEDELTAMRAAEKRVQCSAGRKVVVSRSAELSPCGKYRYTLWRSWAPISGLSRCVTWVMLNPSTADAQIDDPTIGRCIEFSQREQFDHLVVVNLYAYRSTDPRAMLRLDAAEARGPHNLDRLRDAIAQTEKTIVAWGNPGGGHLPPYLDGVGPLWCLGTNKNGSPRHPLYLRGDTPLVRWPS